MKRLILPATLFALVACTSVAARPPEGPARLGQAIAVGSITVRPVKLIEDSRCPMNARCVWAGRVVVRTVVSRGRVRGHYDLTLGKPNSVAEGTLTLNSVTPGRMTGATPSPRDYRFGFAFHGGL